jgi:uncharacterized RDD family membrane protein YckC
VTETPPAGLWRQGAARLLDSVVGVIVWSLSVMWLLIAVWGLRGPPTSAGTVLIMYLAVVMLGLVLHLVYHVVLVGGCGQTLGQMALGIAVVRRDGAVPGYGRAALRCLGGVLVLLTLGIAGLVARVASRGRSLGDCLGGTRVIRVGPRGEGLAPSAWLTAS